MLDFQGLNCVPVPGLYLIHLHYTDFISLLSFFDVSHSYTHLVFQKIETWLLWNIPTNFTSNIEIITVTKCACIGKNIKPAIPVDTGEEYKRWCEVFLINGTDEEEFVSLQRKYFSEGKFTERRSWESYNVLPKPFTIEDNSANVRQNASVLKVNIVCLTKEILSGYFPMLVIWEFQSNQQNFQLSSSNTDCLEWKLWQGISGNGLNFSKVAWL